MDPLPPIALTIDCEECRALHTPICRGCVVTHVLGHEPGGRLELDGGEVRQLELLTEAGLAPVLRFRPRATMAG